MTAPSGARPSIAVTSLVFACAAWLLTPLARADDGIVTDRPDFTESSVVVGKQRFQVETSIALERDRDGATRERTTSTPTLLRYGISDTVELRLESDGRMRSTVSAPGLHSVDSGYADLSLGMKWHALDARGSAPSVGVLVHADVDSGSRPFRGDGVRPSFRVAAEWELPADMAIGIMPGIIFDKNEQGKRYTGGIFAVTLGKDINDRLHTFVELALPRIAKAGNGGSSALVDAGVAYQLTPNCQIDAAVSRGLNHRTADNGVTIGLSFRL